MRAVLIDPDLRRFEELDLPVDPDIGELLEARNGCALGWTSAPSREETECLYIDDCGLLEHKTRFLFDGLYIHGRALLMGFDNQGESIPARSSLETVMSKTLWLEEPAPPKEYLS